jgi:hypothetical protein
MLRFLAFSSVTVAALGMLLAQPAHADLSDCGDISITAEAQCEVVPPSADCELMCEPVSFRAACSARLAVECDAGCSELPSVDCNAECYASCEGQCEVDPGKFDCEAACSADCNGRCVASCEASGNRTGCEAECMGSCGVSCRKNCDIELPSAECRGTCEAGCKGSCEVETNIDCQIDCKADAYARCEADLEGGCKAQCQTMRGALFCDGQYIDNGDNLEQCIDTLRSIDIRVEGDASGDAECVNGVCRAEGRAGASSDCSTSRPGGPANIWALMALIAALLAYVCRVRYPNA